MDNLYAIDEHVYTDTKLKELGLEGDEQYIYIEPSFEHLGNDIYIVLDNGLAMFEVLQKKEPGVYVSLTVEDTGLLKDIVEELETV